jgi:DNA-binding MurR/RpiR family transcriptional regulator
LSDRLRARARNLSPALQRVVEFIDTHRHETMTKSAMELAAEIGTSDATVIRAVQAIGFDGLRELKHVLASASGAGHTPVDSIARTFASLNGRSATAVDQVFSDHLAAFNALEHLETQTSIAAAIECLASANRVGVFGGGAAAFLGRYLALCLNQIGRPTTTFDGYTAPLPEQLLEMRNCSAVLMLAFGGPHKEATSTIAEARRLKVPIVLVTNCDERALTRHASVVVHVTCNQAGRVMMHGATLVCLEAIIMGMVAADPPKTMSALEKLGELRRSVYKQ